MGNLFCQDAHIYPGLPPLCSYNVEKLLTRMPKSCYNIAKNKKKGWLNFKTSCLNFLIFLYRRKSKLYYSFFAAIVNILLLKNCLQIWAKLKDTSKSNRTKHLVRLCWKLFNKFAWIEVFYKIVNFFMLGMDSKPIFYSKIIRKTKLKFLEVARTAKSCSKRQKLLKSCRVQSGQAHIHVFNINQQLGANFFEEW